jgi:large subunit ribosomal protein L14e
MVRKSRSDTLPIIEVGRVCVKLNGREAGRKCVIVDVIDKNFVLITGPKKVNGVRRRRTNVKHVEPTSEAIDIKKGATDEDVAKIADKSKKTNYLKEAVTIKEISVAA